MKSPVWLKAALWGAACGAAVLVFVGFFQFGWQTAASASQAAQQKADNAVVAAFVAFCVAKAIKTTTGNACRTSERTILLLAERNGS
jgi:hypothetical protein